MLCESLGLPSDYFDGDQTGGDMILGINRYPPCPNPDVTFGLPPHCDRNLITLVLPSSVPGLQVFYKGDWIMVKPMRYSFVVNFGLHLEVSSSTLITVVYMYLLASLICALELLSVVLPTVSITLVLTTCFIGLLHWFLTIYILLIGCDKWHPKERRAPRDNQLGASKDVCGHNHTWDPRLPHWTRGRPPQRERSPALPHCHALRFQAHLHQIP